MYKVGDLVYVYLNDLKISLPNMDNLLYSRFGYITDVQEIVDDNGNKFYSYAVKTRTNTTMKVDPSRGFKLCDMAELKDIIESIKKDIPNSKYNDMLAMITLHKNTQQTQS